MKRGTLLFWLAFSFLGLLASGACSRKIETPRIEINITQGKPSPAYINGYRKTLGGQVLAYHSSHPDADSALLARANKDTSAIRWETDPLSAAQGEFYQLVWLAGLECAGWPGKEVHTFDFSVNGEIWFTFRNLKDDNAKKWKVTGRHGAELSFESTLVDRAGDLFGTMFLRIPKNEVKAGSPLTLQVQGRDEKSLDWYMALEYSFKFTPALRAEPALTAQEKQLLRLSVDNLQEGRMVAVSAEGKDPVQQPLKIGANILYVSIPAAEVTYEIPVIVRINGENISHRTSLWLKPVSRREFYLLSYSHNDIGYTDIQPVIEKKQWANLDEALRLIKQTENYPWEARYKWNLEVMWPLEGYFAQASEAKRQEVIQAVRNGSLGLNALYANVLTGLANSPEMIRFTEYARRFAEQNQTPITTALVSDIPGHTWGIVPALARSGVKYFASAPNSGDRIGFVLKQWGDKPFYWVSQSGEEKVLMWVAGAGYAGFHEGDLTRLGDEKLLRMMRRLDDSGYPYEILQLPYTIGGDNGPPDPNLSDFVKKWNERFASPRLVIATHAQMFTEFEKRHGASLPSVRGDFTPYWEDGAVSTAAETALNRHSVDRLLQGQALWAMRQPAAFPARQYQAAWRNVILWDEHTWGAHNSVSEPDLPEVKEQWRIKRQFALDADRMSHELMGGWRPAPKNAGGSFAVYNVNSWPRTDLVRLARAQSAAGDMVVDEKGDVLPSQRLSTGELAVLFENVPPFSGKQIQVKPGPAGSRGSCKTSATTLANSLLSLSIDAKQGTISSLTLGQEKMEFVDRAQGPGLNQYLYVPGKDAENARSLSGVRVRVKENGGLVASLLVEASAPGCRKYAAEYLVVEGIPRVEIINQIDKRAVREKEGVHIAFPFLLPDGQLRYDVADGIVRPESDQLEGSCKNFYSIQSWVDVSNGERGVTWASADAPLIEIGSITAELPWAAKAQASSRFYSYVMNNYWHTNYKADQEGPVTFRYVIVPHAGFKPAEAVRIGRETREPLVVIPDDTNPQPGVSLFKIQPEDILVTELEALPGGNGWLVCLYNPKGEAQNALLAWNRTTAVSFSISDRAGRAGKEVTGPIKVAAWGSVYVRIVPTPGRK